MITKDQIKEELIYCLLEQQYSGELNLMGLAIIGLFEIEGNLIERISEEEL